MPYEDSGLDLLKIQDIIWIKKLKKLLGNLRAKTRGGDLIHSNLEYLQIDIGYEEIVLNSKPFWKPTWVEEIYQQLINIRITLKINH